MGVGAIIGGVASVAGSIIGGSKANKAAKNAANTAADAQVQVADKNNALAREIYGENKAVLAPWQQLGTNANPQINDMLNLLPGGSGENMGFDAYKRSSGYDARLQEGLGVIRGGFSGQGTLQSGTALKSLMEYGQDYATNERNSYINQLMPRLNALESQRNLGFNAAGAQTGVATNFSNTTSANNQNAADGISNAALYKAANTTSPFGNALSALGGGALAYGINSIGK